MTAWGNLTEPEIAIARKAGALVVLPVGATEQHAGHLPVSTDTRLAECIALAAAARAGVPVLVAPALAYGFSAHHRGFTGTLTLSTATLIATVKDIVGSLAEAGFRRTLIVNGHGGNTAPLRTAVADLVTAGIGVGVVDYWGPAAARVAAMLTGVVRRPGHACEFETALQLALHADDPALVAKVVAAIEGLPPRPAQPYLEGDGADPVEAAGAWWPPVFTGDALGYFGDPSRATPENGAAMLEAVTAALAEFFARFHAVPLRVWRDAAEGGGRLFP